MHVASVSWSGTRPGTSRGFNWCSSRATAVSPSDYDIDPSGPRRDHAGHGYLHQGKTPGDTWPDEPRLGEYPWLGVIAEVH